MEPNLPTKKTGRDKDGSPDTKEGSDKVGSWRTQDQDWSEIANALDKAKVDIEDSTGNLCEPWVTQDDNPTYVHHQTKSGWSTSLDGLSG